MFRRGPCWTHLREGHYVSLVGFRFCRTKLFGYVPIPFHTDFDEVNLRFYVRRKEHDEDRRGVVFIAEIVPKRAVARIARFAYGENYVCVPMKHRIDMNDAAKTAEYQCGSRAEVGPGSMRTHPAPPRLPRRVASEQFTAEHYWGYSAKRSGDTLEYRVAHVPWNVWKTTAAGFEGDASGLYGVELGRCFNVRLIRLS